jgi:hypothetical protein
MTLGDYLFSGVFIALILRQIRGRPLTALGLLIPVGIVVVVAFRYLHGIPAGGNDSELVAVCAGAGLVLGILSAMATKVFRRADGTPMAKAGPLAILLWVIGAGSRLAFALYATHGGGPEVARFARAHHIIGSQAWTTAFILMALAEAVSRYGLLAIRALIVKGSGPRSSSMASRQRHLSSSQAK